MLTSAAGQTGIGAAIVDVDRPGLFRVSGGRWSASPLAPLTEAPNGLVAATGRSLWAAASGPSFPRLRVERVTVTPSSPAQFLVGDTLTASADLAAARGPVLVRATTNAGQPGVGVSEADTPARGTLMAVAPGAAVAATLSARRPRAAVWSASRRPRPRPRSGSRRWAFDAPARETAAAGRWDGAISGTRARAAALGDGPKRVHVALSEGLVAVLSKGDAVESVHWGGGPALAETVETSADRATVLHTGEDEGRFSLELLPLASGVQAALAPGAPYEDVHIVAGQVRLALAPSAAGRRIHVRGAEAAPTLIGADGSVSRGADLTAGPRGGTLVIPHGPGLLLAWAEGDGSEASGPWPTGAASAATPAAPPASVMLSGPVSRAPIRDEGARRAARSRSHCGGHAAPPRQ